MSRENKKVIDELIVYVFNSTKSVELLDKFEGFSNDDAPVYKRIVVKNSEDIYLSGQHIYCHLVIERSQNTDYVGDITFTEFKQGKTGALWQHIRSELNEEIIASYKNTDSYYRLKKPYHLRAQNSHNRTGYGWEWDWTGGWGDYTEGTYYGETTDYIFSGVYISTGYNYVPELREKKPIP